MTPARAGSKTLERSERLAGTINLKAGIQSSWVVGPVEDLGNLGLDFPGYLGRECQAGPISGILRLQILPPAPDSLAAQTLGFFLAVRKTACASHDLCGSRSSRQRDGRAHIRPRAGL